MFYMQMVSEIFSDIVKKYGLKEKTIRENVKAFVSSNYVLIIAIGHFEVDVWYSTKDELPGIYDCSNFFAEAYDDSDREGLEKAEDAKTIIKNEFTVISKGLVSKWNNVLEGDTQWIETYKKTLWYSKFSQPDIDSTIFA